MSPKVRLDLRIVVYREDRWWIAHCLEMDIPAEGKTPAEALESLFGLIALQTTTAIQEGNLDSVFSPAPRALWHLYALARDMRWRGKPLPTNVERVGIREYAPAC